MSEQETTEWADCQLCGCTTDPSANAPGDRDNHDVVVEGAPGNGIWLIGSVSSQGRRSGCRTTGSGVTRRVMEP